MTKGHFITGLDIGTDSVKVLAAVSGANGKIEIVGQAQELNDGMRKGVVVNPDQVAEVIRKAVDSAAAEAGRSIRQVFVSINGSHLVFIPSRGLVQVSRADQRISETDIERAFQASRVISLSANQEILDTFPQEFIIDGQASIREALGLRGIRLEAKVLCLAVFSPYLNNLTEAVLNAGLEIENITPAVLASSRALLTPPEKESGVCLLEIGGGNTSLAVFEEGSLVDAMVFPLGANNITNDIAIVLKTEIETAEDIKKEFASGSLRERGGRQLSHKKISTKTLSRVIEARSREILDLAHKELKRIDKTKLPAGVVLTGGGAKLEKLVDLVKKELRLSCRLGLPHGFEPEIEEPGWSTAAGLVLEGTQIFEQEGHLPFSEKGIFGRLKAGFKTFIP